MEEWDPHSDPQIDLLREELAKKWGVEKCKVLIPAHIAIDILQSPARLENIIHTYHQVISGLREPNEEKKLRQERVKALFHYRRQLQDRNEITGKMIVEDLKQGKLLPGEKKTVKLKTTIKTVLEDFKELGLRD